MIFSFYSGKGEKNRGKGMKIIGIDRGINIQLKIEKSFLLFPFPCFTLFHSVQHKHDKHESFNEQNPERNEKRERAKEVNLVTIATYNFS